MRPLRPHATAPIPESSWKELEAARREREALLAKRTRTGEELQALERALAQAVEQDRLELAKAERRAARNGKDVRDPGQDALLVAEERVADVRRRAEALEVALAEHDDELIRLLESRRAAWTDELEQETERARQELRARLEAWVAARADLAELYARTRWLAGYPNARFVVLDHPLLGLSAPHGGPYQWFEVLAAVRADADPPQPIKLAAGAVATPRLTAA